MHRLSILGVMLDKHTRTSLSTKSLDLYFVFIFLSAENAVSHRYVVINGNKMFTALLDNSGYSVECMRFKICDVITPACAALLRDINRKPVVPSHSNTSTQCTETE